MSSSVKRDFARFPVTQGAATSPEARADLQRYGHNVAVYNEWQRVHFKPVIQRLKQRLTVVDRAQAREVLILSQEWLTFEQVALSQLKLPSGIRKHLHDSTIHLIDLVGKYWSNYFSTLERRPTTDVKDSPYGLHNPGLSAFVKDWLQAARLNRVQLQRAFLAKSDGEERYWRIFLAGLARKLVGAEKLPSKQFQDNPCWSARFLLMARCCDTDIDDLSYITDPVTLGGAIAHHNLQGLYSDDHKYRLKYIVESVDSIIQVVLEDLQMADSYAEQAVCTFLEMHRL